MNPTQIVNIKNQTFELLPEKALYWHQERTIILADLHLGKAGHFRKEGIPAPQLITKKTLRKFGDLLRNRMPKRVMILGDLFHSRANREWIQFEEFVTIHSQINFILISGNHDLLHHSFYDHVHMEVLTELVEKEIKFQHEIPQKTNPSLFYLGGHIHPGIKLEGAGREMLRLPAFVLRKNQLLLPAFGEFTGLHILKNESGDQFFPVTGLSVMKLDFTQ